MLYKKEIINICKSKHVAGYIFVNSDGNIISQQINQPAQTAKLIHRSLKNAVQIAGKKLKYIEIGHHEQNHFYIFPVGKNGLGVVKHQGIEKEEFALYMIRSLNQLLKKHR